MKALRKFLAAAGIFLLFTLPAQAQGAGAPTLFGQDDRQAVEESGRPPHSAVCKLVITWQDGTRGEGTGFIYGDYVLATAGHVLFDETAGRGGSPACIEIIPGADGEERPFGSYTAIPGENSAFHTPARWLSCRDWRYDYGAIVLDAPFDPEAGALTLGCGEECSRAALRDAQLSIWGYDAGSFSQLCAQGEVRRVRSFDLLYEIGILPGQSGAPVVDAQGNVVAIQNYGVSLGEEGRALCWNSGARLTGAASRFFSDCRSASQSRASAS